ncbi:MAG TPA: putative sugar nucleotidyl transferase, partial [Chitinophagaceae bacterium]|nr:putative sugar nucleotidyl transferase [Chitinophagaceae bacterium]
MNKILFTEEYCQPENLYPFTLTRQIQDIRVGILTIREKWEKAMGLPSFDRYEDDYKDLERSLTVSKAAQGGLCYMIHANVLPTPSLVKAVKKLKSGEFISTNEDSGIVFCFTSKEIGDKHKIRVTKPVVFNEEIKALHYPWDIIQLNDWAIRQDFLLLRGKRKS